MKLHEYQSKKLFRAAGISVPRGVVVSRPEQAARALDRIGGFPVAVKAQVLAGGRGKAGGVKLARSRTQAMKSVKSILGMKLVTHQTGPAGVNVRRVLIEEGQKIDREYYLGVLADRANRSITLIASAAGGMEIEEVARTRPKEVIRVGIDPLIGIRSYHLNELVISLGIDREHSRGFQELVRRVYGLFIEKDASLVEINPLTLLKNGEWMALDAKVVIDDNALYRHSDLARGRDSSEDDPLERLARARKVNYVRLDGNIGCMVNGAGLAMATMDMIKLFGASPANFLDIGGGAKAEQVTAALKIILKDPNVKGILINIFGGIVRCDEVARGFAEAMKILKVRVPVSIRLTGTNEKEGRRILKEQGFSVYSTMEEAIQDIVRRIGDSNDRREH